MPTASGAGADPSYQATIVRVFDAPRQLVFQNWLEPDLVSVWFAPERYTVTSCEMDARAGGKWRVEYLSAEGEAYAEYGEFREIRAPERLVFSLTQTDGRGHA